MNDAPRNPSAGSHLLATVARSRAASTVVVAWWVVVGLVAALAYVDAVFRGGMAALIGGTAFIAGMCVVMTVARNASAEARRPGSVRRGSLARAAAFGAVVHGGLLSTVTVFAQSSGGVLALVVAGAWFVAVMRPTTLTALGVDVDRPRGPEPGTQRSVPELVGELQTTASQVRATSDPVLKAALAERRGVLIEMRAERDAEALMMLIDESSVRPRASEGPDGPAPA